MSLHTYFLFQRKPVATGEIESPNGRAGLPNYRDPGSARMALEEAMQQSPLHNARTLSQPVKSALEQLLGRTLEDNEEVSVRAYLPHEAPSAEKQRARANELRRLLAESDEKTRTTSESEHEEILDEAIRSVRPGYRIVR